MALDIKHLKAKYARKKMEEIKGVVAKVSRFYRNRILHHNPDALTLGLPMTVCTNWFFPPSIHNLKRQAADLTGVGSPLRNYKDILPPGSKEESREVNSFPILTCVYHLVVQKAK